MTTDARIFRVILPASDMDRAVAFYARLFETPGFGVAPTRHYFNCGGVTLALVDPRGEHPSAEVRPNPDHVYFSVVDLEAMFGRARSAGCSWLEDQIRTRVWGERSFYARDPDGNPICFVDAATLFTGGRRFE